MVSGQGSKSAQTSSKAPVTIGAKPAGAYRPPQSKHTAALQDKVYLKDTSNSSYPGYLACNHKLLKLLIKYWYFLRTQILILLLTCRFIHNQRV
jgi:hypothetical protein